MHGPLDTLLADGVVDEVCGRLKSGKEADLWLVRHGGELVAAKIYKAPHARSFRNNAAYKEGRQVRDTRTQRAMARGSRFGQAAAEEAWKAKETDALYALHAAGVRVPRPVLFHEGVLLMELVLDAHGRPAPRLVDAHVARDAAAPMYADLRAQAIRMLRCDLVHGDLSPYNVLLGAHGPVVIDFPQVVGAAHNSQAEGFFVRDLENLRRFFAAIDPALGSAAGDAREIWRAYVRRELTDGFVPSGRGPHGPHHGARRHGEPQRPRQHRGPGGGGEHGRGEHGRGEHGRGGRSHRSSSREPRRGAAAPEVVRVVRGPHPGPAREPHAGASHPAQPRPQAAGEQAGGDRPGRRRRRRRR